MTDKPTEAQNKEFWEWCGFEDTGASSWYYPPDGKPISRELPRIVLNNLFKYAVPKLDKLNITCGLVAYCNKDDESTKPYYAWLASIDKPYDTWFASNEDPALALFWALWEVKEKNNDTLHK